MFPVDYIPTHLPHSNDEHSKDPLTHYFQQSLHFAPIDLMICCHYAKLANVLAGKSSSPLNTHIAQWYQLVRFVIYQDISDADSSHFMLSWMRESVGKQVQKHTFDAHLQVYMPPHHLIKKMSTHSHVILKENPLNELMTAYHYNVKLPCKYDARYNGIEYNGTIDSARKLPIGLYKMQLSDEPYTLYSLIDHFKEISQEFTKAKESKKSNYEPDMMELG